MKGKKRIIPNLGGNEFLAVLVIQNKVVNLYLLKKKHVHKHMQWKTTLNRYSGSFYFSFVYKFTPGCKKKKCFKMKENKKYIKAEKLVEKQQFNILNVGKIQPKAWQYL